MVNIAALNYLPEASEYPDQIPQLENGWWPTGGAVDPENDGGLMNWQAALLANRTKYLKAAVDQALARGAPDWSAAQQYAPGALVNRNGALWLAVVTNTNSAPTVANTNWSLLLGARANLGDLANTTTAQTNLGGTATGRALFTAADAAAGRAALALASMALETKGTGGTQFRTNSENDTRFAQRANNLSDLSSAATARTNLGATALGSTLFTVADAAAGRTALGLGTAATAVLTTSATDATAGRVTRAGDFGLGAAVNAPTLADWNDHQVPSGLYRITVDTANRPFDLGTVIVQRNGPARVTQTFTQIRLGGLPVLHGYRYHLDGDGWSPLANTYSTVNILGPVSQSGGVPTGAAMQRDSNSDGEYARYADGTQICVGPTASADISSAHGAMFRSAVQTWTFPATAVGLIGGGVTNSGTSQTFWGALRADGATTGEITLFSAVSQTARSYRPFAISRWF